MQMMNPYQGNYEKQSPLIPQQNSTDFLEQAKQEHYLPVAQDIRQSYNPYGQNDDFAADLNPLINKQGSKHIRSLFANLILWAGEITILVLYFMEVIFLDVGALIGICVGIYVFYLILGLCCNPLLSYLSNIEHGLNFKQEYNKIRNMLGHFSFHAQCYHYETRYHTRTTRDADGNSRTQTYTTQQKVITHTATEQLHPRECRDDSGSVDDIRALTEIVFVHNKVNYRFVDEQSRWKFDSLWLSFMNRHRRDVHQDYSQNFVLPNLKSRMTFYIGESPKDYKCVLVVCSIFGMLWPYSMIVQKKVTRYDLQYMKILTI